MKINCKYVLEDLLIFIEENQIPYEEIGGDEKEYLRYHSNRYIFILKTIKGIVKTKNAPGLNLLDIGIVPGHLSFIIKKLFNFNISGVSYEVGKNFDKRMQKVGIPVYKCNIETDVLPFKDETFDVVLCSELIEHLIFDPLHMLNEINRVLRAGGLLIITTPNLGVLSNRIKLLFGKSVNWPISGDLAFFKRNIYDRHNREYTFDEIKYMLKITGFDIEEQKMYDYYSEVKNKKTKTLLLKIHNLVTFLKPSFRQNILVVAKK